MKKKYFLDLLKNNKQFCVPFNHDNYSNNKRPHSWLKQLENDTIKMNSFYFYEEKENLFFIDGAKRFTSLFILLCVICNKFYENDEKEEYYDILNNYILTEDGKNKLFLRYEDDCFLKDIINSINDENMQIEDDTSCSNLLSTYHNYNDSFNINNNYHLIYNNLRNIKIPYKILPINDSYNIFNKFNGDSLKSNYKNHIIIKNYFLEHLKKKDIQNFKEIWLKLEKLPDKHKAEYGDKKISLPDYFLNIYLNIKLKYIPEHNKISDDFINYAKNNDLKSIINEIDKYLGYYENLFLGCEKDQKLKNHFNNIGQIFSKRLYDNSKKDKFSYMELQIFLLKVYDDYENFLDKNDLIFIVECIESYIIRRDLCDITSNSLNETFIKVYDNIKQDDYINSFITLIINLKSNEIFPNDDKIREELLKHDFFNEEDIKNIILDRLENSLRQTPINLKKYQIEHIMPQTLTDEWRKELGNKAEQIYKKYLNTLGNLTYLTSEMNKLLSNKPFKYKKEKGYKCSDIRLSYDILEFEVWNEKTIKQRTSKLTEMIINIWYYPKTTKMYNDAIVEDRSIKEINYDKNILIKLDKE